MSIHQLYSQGHPYTWQERLDQASSESDVVSVAREYIATLSLDELRTLPPELRPGKLVDANDITTYAFELVRHECHDQGAQKLVQRLAHVLSRSSIRLSQIMAAEHHYAAHAPRDGNAQQRCA